MKCLVVVSSRFNKAVSEFALSIGPSGLLEMGQLTTGLLRENLSCTRRTGPVSLGGLESEKFSLGGVGWGWKWYSHCKIYHSVCWRRP